MEPASNLHHTMSTKSSKSMGCLRIDWLNADAELVKAATDIGVAAYELCGRTPAPILDGHMCWAELHATLREDGMRPVAWLMFWQRIEVPAAADTPAEGAPATAARRTRTVARGIVQAVLDLSWHVLHDRLTGRFHTVPRTLDAACSALRSQARDVLRSVAACEAVRRGAAHPLPHVILEHGTGFEAWRHRRPVRPPPPVELTEDSVLAVEFPDEEEGYDGRDPDDLPPSDEDWMECEDVE